MQSFWRSTRLMGLLTFLCSSPSFCQSTWIEVQSPHFRVLTDSNAKSGRAVANEFEQIRHVMAVRFQDPEINSAVPMTIIAARNSDTVRDLMPRAWKDTGGTFAGMLMAGWERQTAMVRLNAFENHARGPVYFEYTGSVLTSKFHWLPSWLYRGLCEYFSFTEFDSQRIAVGGPSPDWIAYLRTRRLLPISQMMDDSKSFQNSDDQMIWMGESWAAVHYMVSGEGMGNGAKLADFIHKVATGTPQLEAFRAVFGDIALFDRGLQNYVELKTFYYQPMPLDAAIAPDGFAIRTLSPEEADYEIGAFQVQVGERKAGREHLEHALMLGDSLAAAHEELGFADFLDGKDDDAAKEWHKALELDPSRYRSLFALTMQASPLASQSYQQLAETRMALQKVIDLAPKYAAAYADLGLVDGRLGSLQRAYDDVHKAETLAPWRAGYHILAGYLLFRANQPEKAAGFARTIAAEWKGVDHDEAVDLWQSIPAEMRGAGDSLTLQLPKGSTLTRGQLTDEACPADGAGDVTLTVIPDGEGAKPVVLRSKGPRLRVGYSDTFWWGEDHYTLCHHLTGHRVLAAVKDGVVVELEVRDDFPWH